MRKLLYSPWQTLEVPSALTPIGQLHQSPPLPVPGGLGRCPSHQSHVLEHRDTYGQVQGRSGGHQGSSVSRRCQLSCGQALASTGSATSGLKPELSLSVLFSETQLGVLQTNFFHWFFVLVLKPWSDHKGETSCTAFFLSFFLGWWIPN